MGVGLQSVRLRPEETFFFLRFFLWTPWLICSASSRYALVKEALRERKYFLDTAPHLSMWLPIMIPLQKWWQAPYFWAGTKFYDFLAGSEGIESSYFLTRSRALDAFPMLKKENLIGALVYYGRLEWVSIIHGLLLMNLQMEHTMILE